AHTKEKWALEDLAALFYLHAQIKGIKEEWKMRVVFIDEVQDYSLFQLAALKSGLETDMFTLVGDLAQGIHSYRSLTEWDSVLKLFPRANFFTLQKSYRTTIEIMEVANQILSKMNESLPLVEPVVRHGKSPTFVQNETFNPKQIKEIYESIKQNGHHTVALICKTSNEAAYFTELLLNDDIEAELLTETSELGTSKLLVLPSYLAKGLEFDAVIVAAFSIPYADT
ncbi:DNA helicase, partial [Butyricicoccus sp. 1XD8-22]